MGEKRIDLEVTQHASQSGPLETVCSQFEADRKSDRDLRIEDLLAEWDEPERSKLLSELLLIELSYACESGETLVSHIYENRFPEHRDVVKDVFDRWLQGRSSEAGSDIDDTLPMESRFGKLRLHAQGGLGMVFRAEDQQLSREVAVKFIRTNLADDTESRDRFRLEAEITSRLEHPGIVPVYGLGDTGKGELFYAMRFIQGQTLDDSIARFHQRENSKDESATDRERHYRELLERFVAVCKTMAYAHNRGIVHRDIKPENVMLGRYGETIVIDWGLAMHVGRQGVFKQSGEMTLMPSSGNSSGDSWGGTPAYMSPEQAAGTLELTPASDVYSLGVTLYKILVGAVPFSGTLHELRSKVIRGDFKKPSAVNRKVSKAVEAICLKAMASTPSDRYETALDLARDVENYLADAPVTAYADPFSRKLARWGRRHRMASQGILGSLLLLTLAGIFASAVFRNLHSEASALQQQERELREQSLSASARFAARTIADKIDIRLRILEALAADAQLHEFIKVIGADPQNESLRVPLQAWFDTQREIHRQMEDHAWSIFAVDGSQVGRCPQYQEDGTPFGSLRQRYNYRDYFHGRGTDFETGPPGENSHVSVAMESTNGGLIVVLSAPIRAPGQTPLGIISMSIELGQFVDLDVRLPEGEKVILIDTRRYFMKLNDSETTRGPSGEGLVLHHPDLPLNANAEDIPHLERSIVKHIRETSKDGSPRQNMLPDEYRDPLSADSERAPLAAFAPVILTARPLDSEVRRTDWFVIIQQQ